MGPTVPIFLAVGNFGDGFSNLLPVQSQNHIFEELDFQINSIEHPNLVESLLQDLFIAEIVSWYVLLAVHEVKGGLILDFQVYFVGEILDALLIFGVHGGKLLQLGIELPPDFVLLLLLVFLVEIGDHLIQLPRFLLEFRLVVFAVPVPRHDGLLLFDHLAHPVDELLVASFCRMGIGEVNEQMLQEVLLVLGLQRRAELGLQLHHLVDGQEGLPVVEQLLGL